MAKRAPVQLALWPEAAKAKYRNSEADSDKLLSDYWNWAARVALEMSHTRPGYDVDDLVQAARIGLWKAAMRYRQDSPVRFAVFAESWVKGGIRMATRRGNALNAAMGSIDDEANGLDRLGRFYFDSEPWRLQALEARLSADSRILLGLLVEGYTFEEIAAQRGLMVTDVERLIEDLKREAGSK